MPTDPNVTATAPVVVLGLGNVLLRDDGVGIELLARTRASFGGDPRRVSFVDGGTQGLALLPYLSDRRALLILDAVALGGAPGDVHVVESVEAIGSRSTTAHESNARDLLAAAALLGDAPPTSILVGIEPAEVRTGLGLSDPVLRALPRAAAVATNTLRRLLDDTRNARETPHTCTR